MISDSEPGEPSPHWLAMLLFGKSALLPGVIGGVLITVTDGNPTAILATTLVLGAMAMTSFFAYLDFGSVTAWWRELLDEARIKLETSRARHNETEEERRQITARALPRECFAEAYYYGTRRRHRPTHPHYNLALVSEKGGWIMQIELPSEAEIDAHHLVLFEGDLELWLPAASTKYREATFMLAGSPRGYTVELREGELLRVGGEYSVIVRGGEDLDVAHRDIVLAKHPDLQWLDHVSREALARRKREAESNH